MSRQAVKLSGKRMAQPGAWAKEAVFPAEETGTVKALAGTVREAGKAAVTGAVAALPEAEKAAGTGTVAALAEAVKEAETGTVAVLAGTEKEAEMGTVAAFLGTEKEAETETAAVLVGTGKEAETEAVAALAGTEREAVTAAEAAALAEGVPEGATTEADPNQLLSRLSRPSQPAAVPTKMRIRMISTIKRTWMRKRAA